MSESFGDAWRKVRLHAPDAPFGLVKEWTQHAYEDLCRRRPWGFLRQHAQLVVPAARSLSATFVVNSLTVTSAALFLATDVGRQIRTSNLPIYTIQTFVDASTVTIDMPWTGTVGAATATISGTYQTLPADFGAFEVILDPSMQRILPWWFTQEDLARVDPMRFSTGDLQRCLVSRALSTVPSTLGRVTYEWWPGPTTAKAYPYYYRQQAALLADTDPLLGILTARVLEMGALAYCAAWPGTVERKNPYFNLQLAMGLKDAFDRECAKIELRDDDQYQQTWAAQPFNRWAVWDLGFGDTHTLRSTDATVGAYI